MLTGQESLHLRAFNDLVDFSIAAERTLREKIKKIRMAQAMSGKQGQQKQISTLSEGTQMEYQTYADDSS